MRKITDKKGHERRGLEGDGMGIKKNRSLMTIPRDESSRMIPSPYIHISFITLNSATTQLSHEKSLQIMDG